MYGSSSDSDGDVPPVKRNCPDHCMPLHSLPTQDPGGLQLASKQTTVTPKCLPRNTCGSHALRGYVSKRKASDQPAQLPAIDSIQAPDKDSQKSSLHAYLSDYDIGGGPRRKNRIANKCALTLSGHSKPVTALKWHRYNPSVLLSASYDGTIRLWDVDSTQLKKSCLLSYPFHCSAIRGAEWIDHDTAVTCGFDTLAKYSNLETSQVLLSLKHDGLVSAVRVHPDNSNLIITGDELGGLQSWDLVSGRKIRNYAGCSGMILDLEFLSRGTEFVATSDAVRRNASNQLMSVWDTASTIMLSNQIYCEPYSCPCIHAHPNEAAFLAQSNGNYIVEFQSHKPYKLKKHKRYEGHRVEGNNVSFDISPDGTLICSGSATGCVYFYDYFSCTLITSLEITHSTIPAMSWHPKRISTIALSDWDGNIFTITQ